MLKSPTPRKTREVPAHERQDTSDNNFKILCRACRDAAAPEASAFAEALVHTAVRDKFNASRTACLELASVCETCLDRYATFLLGAQKLRGDMSYAYGMPYDLALTVAHCCAVLLAFAPVEVRNAGGATLHLDSASHTEEWPASVPGVASALVKIAKVSLPPCGDPAFTFLCEVVRQRSAALCLQLAVHTTTTRPGVARRGRSPKKSPSPRQFRAAGSIVHAAHRRAETKLGVGEQFTLSCPRDGSMETIRVMLIEDRMALVRCATDNSYRTVQVEKLVRAEFQGEELAKHFATLGLHVDAETADVVKAFRRLALKYHPDKGGDTARFRQVREAFEAVHSATVAMDPSSCTERFSSNSACATPAQKDNNVDGNVFSSPPDKVSTLHGKTPNSVNSPACSPTSLDSPSVVHSPLRKLRKLDSTTSPTLTTSNFPACSSTDPLTTTAKLETHKMKRQRTTTPSGKANSQDITKTPKCRRKPALNDATPTHELDVNGLLQLIWKFAF